MHLNSVTILVDRYPNREQYPFNVKTLRCTPELKFTAPITFFAGEHGTGKSTLLRAVARRCGIYIWADTETLRYQPNRFEGELHNYLRLRWSAAPVPGSFFAAELFRYFAECLDDWARADAALLDYFGGRSLLAQSHGEALMSYFTARYRRRGIYFLDEPETALSPARQVELLQLLAAMARAGHAQFIIATHSPILLSCPDAVILSFDQIPVRPVAYWDTEHYRVYRDFMQSPQKYWTAAGG